MSAHPLVAALRTRAIETLAPLLGTEPVAALIDFPDHANVGDSAIFLGELACLRALGIAPPRYVCDQTRFDARTVRRRAPTGTILLAGGGNFGDLWPAAQQLRETVIRAFPDRRIIQLPQSIHFASKAALIRAREHVGGHADFIMLVRDRRSQAIAHQELGIDAMLCPDLALCLGPLERRHPPSREMLCLIRTDRERTTESAACVDWLSGDDSWLRTIGRAMDSASSWPLAGEAIGQLRRRTYIPLADARLTRGARLLESARVVVTDRLHGHILCLMLDIPHVLLDNSYGKLSSFHETWTRNAEDVEFANQFDQAVVAARRLGQQAQA